MMKAILIVLFVLIFITSCGRSSETSGVTKSRMIALELYVCEIYANNQLPSGEYKSSYLMPIIENHNVMHTDFHEFVDGEGDFFNISYHEGDRLVRIWSNGENGSNEFGGGDDILKIIKLE